VQEKEHNMRLFATPLMRAFGSIMKYFARSCPVCRSDGIRAPALLVAAFRTTARCSICGSAVILTGLGAFLVSVLFCTSIVVGLIFWSFLWSLSFALLAAVATFIAPVRADEADPITMANLTRAKLGAAGRRVSAQKDKPIHSHDAGPHP
jgi:hypothetical protein